jgi:hypothetical protein
LSIKAIRRAATPVGQFSFWPDGFPYVVGTVSGGESITGTGAEDNNICAAGKALVDLIGLAN